MAPDGLLPPYSRERKALPRQGRLTGQVGGLEVAVAQRGRAATESVGPNSVRPRPSAARPYAACQNLCQNNKHSRYCIAEVHGFCVPLRLLTYSPQSLVRAAEEGRVRPPLRYPALGNLGFEHAIDSTRPIFANLFGLGWRRAVEQPHQG